MSANHPHIGRPNNVMPEEDIVRPGIYERFHLNEAVIKKLPIPGIRVISSLAYGRSLWGQCAKITTELPDGTTKKYFLKVATGPTSSIMCEGEFESMKAIHNLMPTLAPKSWAMGRYRDEECYFMLMDFREVGKQPPDPVKFTARLAELHKKSASPTGKFGFHTITCHGTTPQITKLCDLTLDKIIPRLLDPLQSEGRSIKPCLVHGDCWDENTATDMETGEPFIFDACSFYGHNEYDIGNWRAPRHRLSKEAYIKHYKSNFPPSEPKEDWAGRNLLYSLRFNIGAAILIHGCNQREMVFEDMKELCRTYCPDEYRIFVEGTQISGQDEACAKVQNLPRPFGTST
ncbi:hypothetical protein GX50_00180 [[Emmonsia] crescens]|uniref:protein-ribulosamine 3-kinase n=1 Tax=[Emmonsia] crescens TaxID=73230 RepID=A0A2B7ZTD5_9EURO|nr:hypothetical protein GX50_00180 [Emmonsia crescens]